MDESNLGGRVIARIALSVGIVALWPRLIGLVAAVAAYFALPRILRLFESERKRTKRLGVDREIPLLAELLTAHLLSGVGILEALESLAPSLDSQLSELTDEVAQRLRRGDSNPFAPWCTIPALVRLAEACERAMRSGTSMSTSAMRLAERLRAQEGMQRQADLERAVIRMTLPLGLCLLPAFIATVVIPMAYELFMRIEF